MTPERQRLYRGPEWRALVASVFKRDGYRCIRCGAEKVGGKRLHAHHLIPWAEAPAWRRHEPNLVTLCRDCHLWVHSLDNAAGAFLGCGFPPK